MEKRDKNWWKKANYRMVSNCESCKNSELHCGYYWCNLYRTDVFEGRICDSYEDRNEENINGLDT